MKYNVDIHVVLSTFEDMDDFHDDPDEASERLNFILHAMYDSVQSKFCTTHGNLGNKIAIYQKLMMMNCSIGLTTRWQLGMMRVMKKSLK